jgi:FixJ family two-component response regulator
MTQQSELVVIVDDDFSVCEALSDLLASHNLESVTFQAAAEYLRFGNPNVPSCLVLDLSLPDITGLKLQNPYRQRTIRRSCLSAVMGTSHRRYAR